MKSYTLHAVNDLRYEDTPMPECPEGWAIIKVKAAGICSSDISRVFTKGTYHFPTIPGHEFSGVVQSVGSTEDIEWIGKPVGCFPLIPCRKCDQCKEGRYEMCANYDYIGSRRDGAFAEFVAVPVWNLIPLPCGIDYKYAAMLEPLSVALHAIKMTQIQKGDSVAIIGTGMIGITAAQWAKRFSGDNVCVIGRSEEKRPIVENNDLCYFNQKVDKVGEFDVVVEAVGNPSSIDMSLNIVKPGGKVLLMGNPSGDILLSQNTYWRILRKQLIVCGTWNSSYSGTDPSDWTESVDALVNEEIKVNNLISHTFAQNEVMKGLKLMQEHKEPYCKVMTLWNI